MQTEIIILLTILLFLQQCFYMWQTNKLLNKAMSKNYGEYEQIKAYADRTKKQSEIKLQLPKDDVMDSATSLNKMLGL